MLLHKLNGAIEHLAPLIDLRSPRQVAKPRIIDAITGAVFANPTVRKRRRGNKRTENQQSEHESHNKCMERSYHCNITEIIADVGHLQASADVGHEHESDLQKCKVHATASMEAMPKPTRIEHCKMTLQNSKSTCQCRLTALTQKKYHEQFLYGHRFGNDCIS